MNNRKRNALREAVEFLNKAIIIVENVSDQEQDAIDNMPENLQDSDRYESMEYAVDSLSSATERIEEAVEYVQEAMR